MTGEPRPLNGKPVIYHFCWIVAQYTLYNIHYTIYNIYTYNGDNKELEGLQGLGIDHNDPSKPSHRLTNGPEPSKTIESNGSNIKKPS